MQIDWEIPFPTGLLAATCVLFVIGSRYNPA
jgi:hypothetical protein